MRTHTLAHHILWLFFLCFVPLAGKAGGLISVSPTSVTAGCSVTFTCNATGSYYQWSFGPGAVVTSVGGATYQTTQNIFTQTGPHKVIVSAQANNVWVSDSVTINVAPNPVTVLLSANRDTICQGTSIQYTASPSGYLQYTFIVNGVPVQNTSSNILAITNLQPGDSVAVYCFDGACYSNTSAAHYPVVKEIPVVNITDSDANDTICGGDPVTFTASPATYDSYNFYNGGGLMQQANANTWNTSILGQGNSIYVIATHNGCQSAWSNISYITVLPNPLPSTTLASAACAGLPVTIQAYPAVINCDWELNWQVVQSGTQLTLNTDTLEPGDQLKVYLTLQGCRTLFDTLDISIGSNPPVPVISNMGDILTSTAANAYSWYLDSTQINNATGRSYTATQSGTYVVQVFNAEGCSSFSNTLEVQVTGISQLSSRPLLQAFMGGNKQLYVVVGEELSAGNAILYDMSGRQVLYFGLNRQRVTIDCSALATGMYILKAGGIAKQLVIK